jgi:hypothetical protein
MDEVKDSIGMIITEDEKDTVEFKGKTITILPAYEWLFLDK